MHTKCLAVCKMTLSNWFFSVSAETKKNGTVFRIKSERMSLKTKTKDKMVIENRCDLNGMCKKDKKKEERISVWNLALNLIFESNAHCSCKNQFEKPEMCILSLLLCSICEKDVC